MLKKDNGPEFHDCLARRVSSQAIFIIEGISQVVDNREPLVTATACSSRSFTNSVHETLRVVSSISLLKCWSE